MNLFSRRVALFLIFVLSGTVDLPTAAAQQPTTESWLGVLKVGAVKLRIQLNLKRADDGSYSGEMISLDQSPLGIEMDQVTRTDKKLDFQIRKIGANFNGQLNADQTVAEGKFKQGQVFDVVFNKVQGEIKPDKHIQTWMGTMAAGGKTFDFQFRVFRDSEGKKLVKLDSFSESLMGIPADFEQAKDQVTITIPMTKAKFVGDLSADGQTIEGNWLQSGGKFPLTLSQVPLEQTRSLDLKRPQTPQPPFAYNSQDFSVAVHEIDPKYADDVVLAGTITSPTEDGPFPTVILISGSGPQDRDETIFEHKPFLVIADHLTKNGYAVVRYDERGVGKSEGVFAEANSTDFAYDVEALVAWAKTQPQVDANKIVLAGHSEGGLIAPMVASRNDDIAGIILLAGPGVPGSQIVLNQTRKIAATAGMPDNVLEMQEKMLKRVLLQLDSGAPATEDFKKSLVAQFDGLTEQQRAEFGINDVAEKTMGMFGSPWMKYFLKYDPREALSKTSCPILSVIGENDLQVDPELNLPAIEAAVKAGKNQDFVQKELPGLNHLFQKSETGSPSEYIQIEQTIDQSLLDEVTTWLDQRFK